MSTEVPTVYTIGHSIHSAETFVGLLTGHGIRSLADIRLIPGSRRHPHFSREALPRSLEPAGISYRHFGDLGGRRRPRKSSVNTAWRVEAFRGYADYMSTPPFLDAVESLLALARTGPTAVMCAEAKWWQCHRRLLADTLVARGVPVLHILSTSEPKPHELSEFAVIEDGRITYPGLI
ncbi:MAG: DUF488 domain-containing protein [Acidobacteriota bacterium]|nr:DUF488 domain-containing protein [Acidobacteriota bacterium]